MTWNFVLQVETLFKILEKNKKDASLNFANLKAGHVEDYFKGLIQEYKTRNSSHQQAMVVVSQPKFVMYAGERWFV